MTRKHLQRALSQRGQNTVEYLLILAVVVGVVLTVGAMFKTQIGGFFNSVMANIQNAGNSMASNQGH